MDEEDDLVFEGENLTWDVVDSAIGVEEPTYHTRGKGKKHMVSTSSSNTRPPRPPKQVEKGKDKGKSVRGSYLKLRDEEEIEYKEDEEDDEEDEYKEEDPQYCDEEDEELGEEEKEEEEEEEEGGDDDTEFDD